MKLLFIYGPPGVGKLTVAGELAKRTGYKVFHNHLSVDCVLPVFDFGTDSFWKLIGIIREEVIAEAAREEQNLIHTFCYAKGHDEDYVETIVKAVEQNGGEICFVLLTCERCELEKRVVAEDRKKFAKANDLELLNEILEKYDLFSPVPERESLQIDNTEITAEETARQIMAHFDLRGVA